MVLGDRPGSIESIFRIGKAQVEKADVGMVSSARGNASGIRRGDREDLMIPLRQGGGQRFAQDPLVVTENQSHVLLPLRGFRPPRGGARDWHAPRRAGRARS